MDVIKLHDTYLVADKVVWVGPISGKKDSYQFTIYFTGDSLIFRGTKDECEAQRVEFVQALIEAV
jgi:hypothetical protein